MNEVMGYITQLSKKIDALEKRIEILESSEAILSVEDSSLESRIYALEEATKPRLRGRPKGSFKNREMEED